MLTAPVAPLALPPIAAISISPFPSLVPLLIDIVPRFTTFPIAPSTVMFPVPLVIVKFSALPDALSIAPSIWTFPAPVPVFIVVELFPPSSMLPVSKVMSVPSVMNSTALVLVIAIVPAPAAASKVAVPVSMS